MEKHCLTLDNAPNVIKRDMVTLVILLFQCVTMINGQQHVVIKPDEAHPLDIEPLIIDIRVPDVNICQQISTDDCKNLIHQMLKCQQIIFNDPGFSYQQYKKNIDIHRQILVKYQSRCEGTHNDYLVNVSFDLKKA